ncbi:MAG: ATP-binding cassette, subfamily bacterial [Mycobacterium sp.]|nr:ATP-binding cassette, subfamily bacterial [Mycobacterium sp.]
MLRDVRGLIVVLVVVGVIASALPYVSAAAFGPMMQVVADAGTSGNLGGVWGLRGPLVARDDGVLSGVAGSVPFAMLLATWAASLMLAQLMYLVNAWVGTKVEMVLVTDIRQRVHDHLQTLSLDFFTASRCGALMQRVTVESTGVHRLLTNCLLPPLIDTVVLVVAVGCLVALSWQMTVAALVLTPLALLVLKYAGRHVQAAVRRTMDADRAMGAELEQTISGISEIQLFNAQSVRSKRFHEVSDRAAKSDASTVMWMQATANGSQVFIALGEVHGNLVFEDVAFGYTAGQMVLDGISFSIKEGETVALVGGIGSGKSTVYNLLLQYLDPQRGRILIDGHPITEVTIASLRDQVSKLAQFPFFTKDTIRENIRLARPGATDADIEAACENANVHSVIIDPTKMHDGYDTVVDVQVPSGGQKRLIALARCLLRKPEVLLLDEPTENLDADQRARLTGVIRGYAKDRTCLVISHDMDFIAAVADRILVIEHGRIAQQGDHRTLIAEGGLYKRLYEAQNVDPDLVYPYPSAAEVG